MIFVTGDTHGDWMTRLNSHSFPEGVELTKDDYVIISSYVNVYRRSLAYCGSVNGVSIHPMLMFIRFLQCICKYAGHVSIHPMLMFIQRISAISKNNYTNFSSIYQLFSIFYQPITHFIVFK